MRDNYTKLTKWLYGVIIFTGLAFVSMLVSGKLFFGKVQENQTLSDVSATPVVSVQSDIESDGKNMEHQMMVPQYIPERWKEFYTALCSVIEGEEFEGEKVIITTDLPSDDIGNILDAVKCDKFDSFNNVNLLFYDNGDGTKTYTTYAGLVKCYKKVKQQEAPLRSIARSLVSDGMTEREMSDCFIKWLCNNFDYESDIRVFTTCIETGKANCEGFSQMYRVMCDEVGIHCELVSGDTIDDGEDRWDHMWNRVLIDGTWYYMDITWYDSDKFFNECCLYSEYLWENHRLVYMN